MKFNGNLVRRLRERLGMTQQELAQAAGTVQGAISYYENGTRAPSAQILPALAEALRVSIDDLFDECEGGEWRWSSYWIAKPWSP